MASAAAAPNSNDILSSATFNTSRQSSSSSSPYDAPTASSILAGLPVDPSSLHPLAGLVDNKDIDYLLLEDDKISGVEGGKSVLPSRGWGDELCYGTGSTYLAGLAAGGIWGFTEGLRKPLLPRAPAAAPSPLNPSATVPPTTTVPPASTIASQQTAFAKSAATAAAAPQSGAAAATAGTEGAAGAAARAATKVPFRLRWNQVLNQVTRRGSFTGNSAGVLALIYNGFNSTLDSYRGGKHDIYGSMAAGAATGLVWKSTAGPKNMLIASGLMTVGAAGWTKLKTQFL